MWRRRFGGDPAIIGRPLLLDGETYQVVGVMPHAFSFPNGAEIWAPLSFDQKTAANRAERYLSVVGTLVPTGAAVVLGGGAEGGVAVFTLAFAFFVLPHALVAVPVATALAPRAAETWQRGERHETRELIERATMVVVPLLSFAGAAMFGFAQREQPSSSGPFGRLSSLGRGEVA